MNSSMVLKNVQEKWNVDNHTLHLRMELPKSLIKVLSHYESHQQMEHTSVMLVNVGATMEKVTRKFRE